MTTFFLPHVLREEKDRHGWVSREQYHFGRMPPELRLDSGMLGVSPSVLGQGVQRQPPLLSGSSGTGAVDVGKCQSRRAGGHRATVADCQQDSSELPVYGYEGPGFISVDELTFDVRLTACWCAWRRQSGSYAWAFLPSSHSLRLTLTGLMRSSRCLAVSPPPSS